MVVSIELSKILNLFWQKAQRHVDCHFFLFKNGGAVQKADYVTSDRATQQAESFQKLICI